MQRQLAEMDRNGTLARFVAPLVNWASDKDNKPTRGLMEKTAGIDAKADLAEIPRPHFRQRGQAARE